MEAIGIKNERQPAFDRLHWRDEHRADKIKKKTGGDPAGNFLEAKNVDVEAVNSSSGSETSMIALRQGTRRNLGGGSMIVVGALAALVVGLEGCSSKPEATSDRTVIAATSKSPESDASNAKVVTMIMPYGGRNVEVIIWRQAALEEMGRFVGVFGAILDDRSMKKDDPPARQAEMVREAVERGSNALIVVADDPKVIAPALLEAREKGVHVVLLSRPVPVEGHEPFPLIRYPGLDDLAKKMLVTARLIAKDRKIADDAPAMILLHEPRDDHTEQRLAALKKALKDDKIPLVAVESFEEYPAKAEAAIGKVIKKYPDLGYILADEDQGIEGTSAARGFYNPEKPPVVIGFIWNSKNLVLLRSGDVAAAANRRVQAGAARAIKAAVALCRGEKLPDLDIHPNIEQASDPIAAGRQNIKSFKLRPPESGRR